MLKKLAITTCVEAVVLTAAALTNPQFWSENAVWIVGLAVAVLLAIALYDWLKAQGKSEVGRAQTTHGNLSPIFGAVGRDVHIYATPPPEEPEPAKSPWDDPNFSLLQPISASSPPVGLHPDMTLERVVERARKRIGAPPKETDQDIDHFILDGIVNRPLSTWGRVAVGKPVTPIWKEAWQRGDFSHVRGTLRYRHPDNPNAVHTWSDIQFCYAEVKRWVKPDLGPHGWMAGDV